MLPEGGKMAERLQDITAQRIRHRRPLQYLNALAAGTIQKEVKELAKPFAKSGIWKKLTGFLGEDKAKELYDSYQK